MAKKETKRDIKVVNIVVSTSSRAARLCAQVPALWTR